MNFRFEMKRATTLSMMLAAGSMLVAQVTTGNLAGAVKDPKGAPIAGAQVTITSPALFAPRIVVTDDHGEWRAPMLPPGGYVVKASKASYVGVPSKEIRVGLGTNMRQDIILKPVTEQNVVVEVIGSSTAGVDKADTKVATNFSAETMATLPSSDRGFSGAANLTPGVAMGQSGQYSIRGGATNSTLYRVNGVDIKDDIQGSQTGTGMIDDLVEDIQVVVSPLNARNGRTFGGAINVVTKTGGNEFSGSIRATFVRPSWHAKDRDTRAVDFANQKDDYSTRQYDVTLMGPIWKDHIWFSMGTILKPKEVDNRQLPTFGADQYNRAYVTGNANIDAVTAAGPGNGYQFTRFDAGMPYQQKEDNKYFETKITAAINADHTLEFSYKWDKNELSNRDSYNSGAVNSGIAARLASLDKQSSETKNIGFGYRGVITSKIFVEARYNKSDAVINWPKSHEPAFPNPVLLRIFDVNSNALYPWWGGKSTPEVRGNRAGEINFKLYLDGFGQHDIDTGYQYYEGIYDTTSKEGRDNRIFRAGGAYMNAAGDVLFPTMVHPGPNVLGQSGSGLTGIAPTLAQYYGKDGRNRNISTAVYVNDAWTINNNFNLMVGLRYNQVRMVDTTTRELASSSNFEPRLQLKYDPFGDSKHVFSFTASRNSGDFVSGFTRLFLTTAQSAFTYSAWKGIAGQPAAGSASDGGMYGVRFVTYDQLTDISNYNAPYNYSNSSKKYKIDPNLKAPFVEEMTVGYNRSYEGGSKVSLTYVYRRWKQDWAIGQDYNVDQMVRVSDPSGATKADGSPLNADLMVGTQRVFNSDDLRREYNAIELDWTNNVNAVFQWGGNLTYASLVGNHNGGDSPNSSFRDNSVTGYYGNRRWLTYRGVSEGVFAPFGKLLNNQTLKARVWATLTQPVGKGRLSYGFIFNYDTGSPYDLNGTAPMQLTTIASVGGVAVPAAEKTPTYNTFNGGRGAFTYNDSYSVDFKLSWNLPLGISTMALIGDFKVNNIFNHMTELSWDTNVWQPTAGSSAYGIPQTFYMQDASAFGRAAEHEARGYWGGARSFSMSMGLRF